MPTGSASVHIPQRKSVFIICLSVFYVWTSCCSHSCVLKWASPSLNHGFVSHPDFTKVVAIHSWVITVNDWTAQAWSNANQGSYKKIGSLFGSSLDHLSTLDLSNLTESCVNCLLNVSCITRDSWFSSSSCKCWMCVLSAVSWDFCELIRSSRDFFSWSIT